MRKLTLKVFMSMLLICSGMITNAQMYGKWVISTEDSIAISGHQSHLLTFQDDAITIENLPIGLPTGEECEVNIGAYNAFYDLLFYILDSYMCYGNVYFDYNYRQDDFRPDCQMIKFPGANDETFLFLYSVEDQGKDDLHCEGAKITMNNDVPEVTYVYDIVSETSGSSSIGFALTREVNEERTIYYSSLNYNSANTGLRKRVINEQGIGVSQLLLSPDANISENDFSAHNMEIFDGEGNDVLAWITTNHSSSSKIFIYFVDQFTADVIDLSLGRVGGIEFSALNDSILFASCTDLGIIALNYYTGEIVDTLYAAPELDYNHTGLQMAPDGNIYAVSNDGKWLGRINMPQQTFAPEAKLIAAVNKHLATYSTFEDKKYYYLPENSQTYNYLVLDYDIVQHPCPDSYDGIVRVFANNGFPPYIYQLYMYDQTTASWIEHGNSITTSETEHTFYNLGEGLYKCLVTDNSGYSDEVFFELNSDERFDVKDFVVIDPENYNPAIWHEFNGKSFARGFKITGNLDAEINNMTMFFGKYARVVIDPGSSLTLNGTTLNYYEPCSKKWQGVEVAGIIDNPQHNANGEIIQGLLVLTDTTIIANAENGVSLYTTTWTESGKRINWNSSGGIIMAKNSFFLNNAKAVHFIPYQNYNPFNGKPMDNVSYFKICDFIVDQNYLDQSSFHKHADLHGVNGIDFKGCIFTNTGTNGVSDYCLGIGAYGAGFTVEPGCTDETISPCPGYRNSSFSGFYAGVAGYTSEMDIERMNIWETDFQNNVIGVYDNGVNSAIIVDCDFEIGRANNSDSECGEPTGLGIDMRNAIGFAIEENNFSKYSPAPNGNYIGVRVYQCPSESDDIYRNQYTGLNVGNQAEKQNRYILIDDKQGVSYICNRNYGNKIDFYIADSSVIRGNVGTDALPSGNILTDTAISIIQFQNDYTQDVRYYYNENEEDEILYEYSDYVYAFGVNANHDCLPHYGGDNGSIELSTAEIQQKESEYAQNLADFYNVESLYNSLIDGGSTTEEISDIQTATPDEMWELRAQLLGHSPHLSQEVLMEMSDRTDVFPDAALLEILSANPEELRKEELISYLENKQDPLPDYMIEILTQVANGSSYKSVLKNQMSDYHNKYVKAAQDIIRSIQQDSITDLVALRQWFDNIGGYEMDKQIIKTYLSENDTSSAIYLLNLIPSLYNFSGKELLEYNDYKAWMNLMIKINSQNRNIYQLNEQEMLLVNDLADSGLGTAKYSARSLLEYGYNAHYCNCPALPDTTGLKSVKPFSRDQWTKAMGLEMKIDPNPADKWAVVNYNLPATAVTSYFSVTDMKGVVIKSILLDEKTGQYVLDTRKIPSGVYICTLTSGDIRVSEKLIIRQ